MLSLLIYTYLFSFTIFFFGILGLLFVARSYFFVIISFETMFLAINLNFFMFSIFTDSILGLSLVFIVLIVSAIEVVILLSFIILVFKKNYMFDFYSSFKNIKN